MFKGGGYARLKGWRDGEYARMARMRERRAEMPAQAPYLSHSYRFLFLWKGKGESSKVEIERYRKRKHPMQNRARNAEGGADGRGPSACPLTDGPESDNESKIVEARRTGIKNKKAGSKYRMTHATYTELKGSHRVGSKRRGKVG